MICALIAVENCPITSVSGPMEILSLANSFVPEASGMSIRIVTEEKPQIECVGGVQLIGHSTLEDTPKADLVIIGAIGHPSQRTEGFNPKTLTWIRDQYQQGAQIVSICTGAFLLAETGLLNGKQATTHWACERIFRERFPEVDLQSERMITQDGSLCCSGGASAFQDMSLFLVRQYFGDQIAHQCAKAVLIDLDRHTQQQFASFNPSRNHKDSVVHHLQDWLKVHATENFSVVDLAVKANLSERQLKRRFKQATGETPLGYIQSLRMEVAKRVLETTNRTIEQVSRDTGYEDVRFFRQLFKRHICLSPTEYRNKFKLD